MTIFAVISFCSFISNQELYGVPYIQLSESYLTYRYLNNNGKIVVMMSYSGKDKETGRPIEVYQITMKHKTRKTMLRNT